MRAKALHQLQSEQHHAPSIDRVVPAVDGNAALCRLRGEAIPPPASPLRSTQIRQHLLTILELMFYDASKRHVRQRARAWAADHRARAGYPIPALGAGSRLCRASRSIPPPNCLPLNAHHLMRTSSQGSGLRTPDPGPVR
jgi:hypothetical protein